MRGLSSKLTTPKWMTSISDWFYSQIKSRRGRKHKPGLASMAQEILQESGILIVVFGGLLPAFEGKAPKPVVAVIGALCWVAAWIAGFFEPPKEGSHEGGSK